MKISPHHIVKAPLLSEESTIQMEEGRYTFRVNPKANKCQIRSAIEQMFNVKVTSINTMNYKGKQSGRRGRARPGYRPDWKKAVVTLREGDTIDLV